MTTQNTNNEPQLTPQQQYMMDQIIATTELEGLTPSQQDIQNLRDVISGHRTVEEVIAELNEENGI